jgi:hypothetical protein
MIYNKSAASRVLRCQPHEVKKLEVWPSVVWVVNDKARFVSKQSFVQDFVHFRKEGSQSLAVTQWPVVSNKSRFFTLKSTHDPNKRYTVTCLPTLTFSCTCEDYKNQVEVGIQMLPANMAMLSYGMGYSSLPEFRDQLLCRRV